MEFRKYLESYNFNIEQEELVEESFLNPDKTLVWFEKPIEKLLNKTISIYHGSPTRIEGDKILPLGVNVGATKFSKLRWSAYYWDNPKYAMMWATCWGLHDAGIPATFVGQNNYVYVCNKTGLDNKEFKQMIVDKKIQTYIYEVRLKASELEMGSCPIIKEYTVSKPMQIYKKYVLTIDEETIDEYCIIVDEAEFNRANSYIMSRTHVPKVRGFILNAILDKYRDIYRNMVYDMIRQDHGRFNPDANLKPYQKQVNKAIKNDVYGVREGVEMKKEEYIIEGRVVEFYDCDILEEGIFDKAKDKFLELKKKEDAKLAAKIQADKAKKGITNDSKPIYKNDCGEPAANQQGYDNYKRMFDKIINDVSKIVKSSLGCTLDNSEMYVKKRQYADNIESVYMSKTIVSFRDNYNKLKKKFPDILEGVNFDDEDAGMIFKAIDEPVFRKIEKLGFNRIGGGYYRYKKFEDLEVELDSESDELLVSIEFAYYKNSIQESFDDFDEYIEEGIFDKFKKKKKEPVKQNNPEPVRKSKTLPGDQVRSDMKKIVAEVKKIMNQPGIKEFNNNGLEIMKPNEWYDSTDPQSDEYEAGVDEFTIVRIDLWDYKGGNPRVIMNESPDGWHPVDHGLEKLRSAIRKMLAEKFPNYRLLEYGGDWDTGYVEIGIK